MAKKYRHYPLVPQSRRRRSWDWTFVLLLCCVAESNDPSHDDLDFHSSFTLSVKNTFKMLIALKVA